MGWLSDLFGGGQAKAARKAAGIQARGAKRVEGVANQYTRSNLADLDKFLAQALRQYNQGQRGARQALDPYARAGRNALTQLQAALGLSGGDASKNFLANFQAGPGYGFAMEQGTKALDRSAAAQGGLYSGAQGKALTEYGHGLANQEFGNLLDRLSGLVSGGQNAAGGIANIISQGAGNRAGAMLDTGRSRVGARQFGLGTIADSINRGADARASGIVGAANARSKGLGNILGLIGGAGKFFLGR